MNFDLIIRGAHVIDPSQNIDAVADVGVLGGITLGVAPQLDPTGCPDVRDGAGLYLCPGLIDLHGHWYEGSLFGVNAELGLNHGVTTAVDAGTTGFSNFPEFRRTVMEPCRAELLGFVHVSYMGLHAPFTEELADLRYARPGETAAVIDRHRDRAVGVKVRIGAPSGSHGEAAFDQALEAAALSRTPLMVHISEGANESYILDRLRPGDILTHCFHGRRNRMLADNPEGFIPQVKLARERGVIFDVGHGCGSFAWESARRAFEHYFYPDTLSTDLHRYSVADLFHLTLPLVMSKFLSLGMPLRDAVAKTTLAPAQVLHRTDLGTLRPGSPANLFLFRIREGEFEFLDTHLKTRKGSRLIEPVLTVRAGRPIEPGSVQHPIRDLYDCDRGIFDWVRQSAAS